MGGVVGGVFASYTYQQLLYRLCILINFACTCLQMFPVAISKLVKGFLHLEAIVLKCYILQPLS